MKILINIYGLVFTKNKRVMVKINILLSIFMIINLSSCKEKNKNNELGFENIKVGKEMNNKIYYDLGEKLLSECLKPVDDIQFKETINNIFSVEIFSIDKKVVVLGKQSDSELALKNYNYLIPSFYNFLYGESEEDVSTEIYKKLNLDKELCNYNNMIFYNDVKATNWIKKNRPTYITNIVKKHGYTDKDDWLKFAFNNSDLSRPDELNEFLFDRKCVEYNNEGTDCTTISVLRKDMLDKMIEHRAELSQLSTIANEVNNDPDNYEGDAKEMYGYLMAKCYKVGQAGMIEYIYDNDSELKEIFEKHNYYGDKDLKEFTNELYIPKNKRFGQSSLGPEMYIAYAVIDDPDGYSNLRADKNSKSKIKKKILKGEKIAIQAQSEGKWWTVITEEGTTGHIHSSRVKIIEVVDTEKLNALLESSK